MDSGVAEFQRCRVGNRERLQKKATGSAVHVITGTHPSVILRRVAGSKPHRLHHKGQILRLTLRYTQDDGVGWDSTLGDGNYGWETATRKGLG